MKLVFKIVRGIKEAWKSLFAKTPVTPEAKKAIGSIEKHYIYMVKVWCDGYYIGYSSNPERRIALHEQGNGARFVEERNGIEEVMFVARVTGCTKEQVLELEDVLALEAAKMLGTQRVRGGSWCMVDDEKHIRSLTIAMKKHFGQEVKARKKWNTFMTSEKITEALVDVLEKEASKLGAEASRIVEYEIAV